MSRRRYEVLYLTDGATYERYLFERRHHQDDPPGNCWIQGSTAIHKRELRGDVVREAAKALLQKNGVILTGMDVDLALSKFTDNLTLDNFRRILMMEGDVGFVELYMGQCRRRMERGRRHMERSRRSDHFYVAFEFLAKYECVHDIDPDWPEFLDEDSTNEFLQKGTVLRMRYPYIRDKNSNCLSIPDAIHYAVVVSDCFAKDNRELPLMRYAYRDLRGISLVTLTHENEEKMPDLAEIVSQELLIDRRSYARMDNLELFEEMSRRYSGSEPSCYKNGANDIGCVPAVNKLEMLFIHKFVEVGTLQMQRIGLLRPKVLNRYIDLYNRYCRENLHLLIDKQGCMFKFEDGKYTDADGRRADICNIMEAAIMEAAGGAVDGEAAFDAYVERWQYGGLLIL